MKRPSELSGSIHRKAPVNYQAAYMEGPSELSGSIHRKAAVNYQAAYIEGPSELSGSIHRKTQVNCQAACIGRPQWTIRQHTWKGPSELSGAVAQQAVFDITTRQCAVSDRNLACADLIRHQTMSQSVESKPVCSHSNCTFCPTAVRQCPTVDWALTSTVRSLSCNRYKVKAQSKRRTRHMTSNWCYSLN